MPGNTLFSIGEALIDMIPSRVGCSFDEVPSFSPRVGGAPANVCAAFTRLGGKSAFLSQLGDDPFGHKIAHELSACGIDLSHLVFTDKANTALAFVTATAPSASTVSPPPTCSILRSRSTRPGSAMPLPCTIAVSPWWTAPCGTPIWPPSPPPGKPGPS